MGTQVARLPQQPSPAPKVTVRRKPPAPWHAFCDMRAVMSVLIQLHVEQKTEAWVASRGIVRWIERQRWRKLPVARRGDVQEAFADRHDIAALVLVLLAELLSEKVIIATWSAVGNRYQICPDEIKVLDDACQGICPQKKKTQPNIRLV
jgi:hypothetical protein